jgi:histidinol-phosphate phosphatase family protein
MSNRVESGKAVFLDRDGTINFDPGYISSPEQLVLLAGVGEALRSLQSAGYKLIVITNQSGVARGLIPAGKLDEIHARMNDLLKPHAVAIDEFFSCLHHPDDGCECRKPRPRMIQEAASKHGIDLKASVMVGDRFTDVEAGRNAGVGRLCLVRTGLGSRTELKLHEHHGERLVHFIGDSLQDVARWILNP